jgi:hypothetical protein
LAGVGDGGVDVAWQADAVDDRRILWELEQRRLIADTLLDYCEYVDRNDPETLVPLVFAADARFELSPSRAVIGHADLVKMFAKTLAGFARTSHHLSNVRISFDGDARAEADSYVYAWHQTPLGQRIEVWGRYHDRLLLTADGWRIERRRLSTAGYDGWEGAPFELMSRLPNPVDPPSPVIQRT